MEAEDYIYIKKNKRREDGVEKTKREAHDRGLNVNVDRKGEE